MKKITIVEQRALKSKAGKDRKGMFKFTREKTTFSTGADEDQKAVAAAFDALFSNQNSREETILNYIGEQENLAKRVIRKAGIEPDDNKTMFTFEDGSRGNSDWAIAEKKRNREPEGYAGDILSNARGLRREIENNNLFEALFYAIKMEEAYGEFNLSQYELEILIGDEVIAKGARSAKFSKEEKQGWITQAKELFDSKSSDYIKSNGSPNYDQAALQIVVTNNMESKSRQTVSKYLSRTMKKK